MKKIEKLEIKNKTTNVYYLNNVFKTINQINYAHLAYLTKISQS